MTTVNVLFTDESSVYNDLPDVTPWPASRNALNWLGGTSIVAHPPCRAWSRMRKFARPPSGERELAIWAVEQVRVHGGVLEHPVGSLLWREAHLPQPMSAKKIDVDEYGGWSMKVNQFDWGHRARKATLLYICGISPQDLPRLKIRLGQPTHTVGSSRRKYRRLPEVSKIERSSTPLEFAEWLVEVARRCTPNPRVISA